MDAPPRRNNNNINNFDALLDELEPYTSAKNSTMVTRLKTAWQNEQLAPDLLKYEHEVLEYLLEATRKQQEIIDKQSNSIESHFQAQLLSMELERVKYMLQSYLRIRLWKIQKFHQHLMESAKDRDLLSEGEQFFLEKYNEMVLQHLHTSFLKDLSEQLQSTTGSDGFRVNMVPQPDLGQFVCCRVKEDVGNFQIDEDAAEGVALSKGLVLVLPYRPIRPLLLTEKVELI